MWNDRDRRGMNVDVGFWMDFVHRLCTVSSQAIHWVAHTVIPCPYRAYKRCLMSSMSCCSFSSSFTMPQIFS